MLVLADGELLFTGTPAELERAVRADPHGAGPDDFEAAFVALPARAGALTPACAGCCSRTCGSCAVRRCWSALLVVYPIVIAVLIGLALSGRPDKPKVAFVNRVPRGESEITIGGETAATPRATPTGCSTSVDPMRVDSRAEAVAKVRDGRGARRR